jgi:tetratricopeptide (TPR) repeat protein
VELGRELGVGDAPAVARFAYGSEAVGGGALMPGGLVLTCAHVVNAALRLEHMAEERPQHSIMVGFPLYGMDPVEAEVVAWRPLVGLGKGDLAVLKLPDSQVRKLAPLVLVKEMPAADDDLRIFGFPLSNPEGVWKVGLRLAGPMVGNWQQLIAKGDRGYKLQQGFSGCPVLNSAGHVVGVLAQADPTVDNGVYIPTAVAMTVLADESGIAPLPTGRPLQKPLASASRQREGQDAAVLDGLWRWLRRRRIRAGHKSVDQSVSQGLPEIWKVPPLRNSDFTGRDSELVALAAALARDRVVALTGRGGVGKTQLAVQYAHRYAREFRLVWWITANLPATLERDLASLSGALGLSEAGWADQPSAAQAARDWLDEHDRWLVVFDAAADPAAVQQWFSNEAKGQVLITSRHQGWDGTARAWPVAALPPEDSAQLLQSRSGQEDQAVAEMLARRLGGLPLALEHAAAYVEVSGTSLPDYLDLLDARASELNAPAIDPASSEQTVAATWELAVRQLRQDTPTAVDLLTVAAFLAPDNIPRSLFSSLNLPDPLRTLDDPLAFNAAFASLAQHSLITPTGETFSVHPLVQKVTRERLSAPDRSAWATTAMDLLQAALYFDANDPASWGPTGRLVPHVLKACQYAQHYEAPPEQISFLLGECGEYLFRRAAFTPAQEAFEQALHVHEDAFGDDPRVAIYLNNLAFVLHDLGDQLGAKAALERARRIDEAEFGPDHPHVAVRVNNLGKTLRELGHLDGAQVAFERALRIDEAAYGPDHPAVASDVNGLGEVLFAKEDREGAQVAFERALRIDEAAYGPDHPAVARDVNNLGLVLEDRGDLDGAQAAFERALRIDQTIYGPDHPAVARDISGRGNALLARRDLYGAQVAFERALRIDEAAYGHHHRNIARDANNLGLVLQDLGDLDGAQAAFERALRTATAEYGSNHPTTRAIRVNLDSLSSE